MKIRIKKFEDISQVGFLVLRDSLGLRRYRKSAKRDEEERKMLLELALRSIQQKEKDNFIPVGYKRRRLKIA